MGKDTLKPEEFLEAHVSCTVRRVSELVLITQKSKYIMKFVFM
jgi:hypothetical protein